jgi:putative membrane protein
MVGHSLWGILVATGLGMLLWAAFKPRRTSGSSADRADSLEILKLRLARGEISIEEYNTLKSML